MKAFIIVFLCSIGFISVVYSQSLDNRIKIIRDYNQVTSIQQLLSKFKGKVVFIDLWATWCEPCKDEFRFSQTLYQELKKRGVEIIYVSLDKDAPDSL
ncbi:TlpA disulfide reductase family protein [Mucilaginibacter sp.]|uniref:TlpA family protein disulfide reductase n=1 Tax=Mucilaginibacter sp. TaxID=1882438 RepID=UPI0034386A0E|nr:hypothetical protein [Mucilaginibacter sp.]